MSDQLRDRLAGAALGALDPSDSAELAAEVERDPTLAAELHGYRTTVAMLESTVARERPSHDLFAGIWAEIGPQLAGRVEAGPERRWSWRLALPAFTVGCGGGRCRVRHRARPRLGQLTRSSRRRRRGRRNA